MENLAARLGEGSNAGDDVFVQHAHITTGFLVAFPNLLADCRKFEPYLFAHLQNLQLYRRHSRGQRFELFHFCSSIATRWARFPRGMPRCEDRT